jgi:hypothetical protein
MQTSYKLISAVFAVALLSAPAVAQQLAKSGKYRGKLTNHGVAGAGQNYELEKSHVFFIGLVDGVFLNDVADGFLDKSEWMCPLVSDSVNGVHVADHGYCIATDKDGDKAFVAFQAKGSAPGSGAGTAQFTGGTGKYSGLQGNNTFHFTFIGNTPAAVTLWEGEWRLP